MDTAVVFCLHYIIRSDIICIFFPDGGYQADTVQMLFVAYIDFR